MLKGAKLLLKTVDAIEFGQFTVIDQSALSHSARELKLAPKIFRENCELDWFRNGIDLQNLIRGLNPYPGAWCVIKDEKGISNILKIFAAEYVPERHQLVPGSLFTDASSFLRVAVTDGYLSLLTVQLEGKKRMTIAEFLRGQQYVNQYSFIKY